MTTFLSRPSIHGIILLCVEVSEFEFKSVAIRERVRLGQPLRTLIHLEMIRQLWTWRSIPCGQLISLSPNFLFHGEI